MDAAGAERRGEVREDEERLGLSRGVVVDQGEAGHQGRSNPSNRIEDGKVAPSNNEAGLVPGLACMHLVVDPHGFTCLHLMVWFRFA